MTLHENARLANALHDREEARLSAIDANGPYECSGILWRTLDGEPIAGWATWSSDWRELLSDISDMEWVTQRSVFRFLSGLYSKPSRGEFLPLGFAFIVLPTCRDAIINIIEEQDGDPLTAALSSPPD